MYANYFLDYASYVILERAVPHVDDGFKPVQRRILHAMNKLDDGRYNKVANIVGDTMKYHPHGDASIGDAIAALGQKGLLIDTQGNWGNIITGDPAAAPRYIEARLTKFAKEVVFSPKVTQWQLSYDGRNKEPVTFAVKFPLLLAQGAEGIAVGLSCKILPHNFNELIDGSIAALRGESFELLPDFPTGGIMDATDYRDGQRGGGRVRVRARITKESAKLIRITETPYGVNTGSLIDSIVAAGEKGKIKISRIEDNTASAADILVHLPAGANVDQMIQALYAFTDCEVSISPNASVIIDNKPSFMGVSEILKYSAERTKDVLRQELEIQLHELNEEWHNSSLEKIFIEERIYRDIEECTTWESVLETIDKGLEPFKKNLKRKVTEEDLVRLTEIKIKRISKYDSFKADDSLKALEKSIAQTEKNLAQLTRYAIRWFEGIRKKYGENFPRRTEITSFSSVDRAEVAAATETLYLDDEGFAGWGVKKGNPICKCSTLDDIIIINNEGKMKIVKIAEKFFAGKKLLHFGIFKKNDDPVFNIVYREGKDGPLLAKRCRTGGTTRDKEYELIPGTPGSRIYHFTIHNTEEESSRIALNIHLRPALRMRNLTRVFNFGELAIKGRSARGNIVTKHTVDKITRHTLETSELPEDSEQTENGNTPPAQEDAGQQPDTPAVSTETIQENNPNAEEQATSPALQETAPEKPSSRKKKKSPSKDSSEESDNNESEQGSLF